MASLSMLKILVLTTYLVLAQLSTSSILVQAQETQQTGFDEAECISCVGTLADYINNGINDSINSDVTITNNTEPPGTYCRQDDGNYDCVRWTNSGVSETSVCSGSAYEYKDVSSCTNYSEIVDGIFGFAKAILIAIIISSCCCCFVVVGAIAACVYCCVQGSNQPLPAGVPGAYQTNPALHQQATNANSEMVLPGTTTIPAQTGLATAVQPAYQPQYYQPTTTMEDQTNVPFAQALSMNPDGTTKQY